MLLSPRAVLDLEEIGDWIARDNAARAVSFVSDLEEQCAAVARSPSIYPRREGLAPGLPMASHGSDLVLFRDLPRENAVRVERIVHGARDLFRLV